MWEALWDDLPQAITNALLVAVYIRLCGIQDRLDK